MYDTYYMTKHMHCPLCRHNLVDHQNGVFVCPDGHGTLVTARYLIDIEDAPAHHELQYPAVDDTKHVVACPHCSAPLYKVDYNGTGIIIDTCTSCHYRWLDAGEIHKIKHFKPNTAAQDLLFILDVDEKIKKAHGRQIKDANPRLPLQGSYRAGAELGSVLTGDSRTRLGAIFGQGFYGIIKGLIHSKTSRIIMLSALVIFGILFLLVFLDAWHAFGY